MGRISRRSALTMLAAMAAGPALSSCGGSENKTTAAPPSSGPTTPGDPLAKLATYTSGYRFPNADSVKFDDEPALAKARVEQRTELAAYLDWARTNGHPDIIPALPRASVKGHEYDIDGLASNLENLDKSPLWGAKEPIGRLLPDSHTINSTLAGYQVGLPLFMIKSLLSKADYAKLVTDSAFTKAAGGKNLIEVYPYATVPLTEPYIPQGVLKAFHGNADLRWLIVNPGSAMTLDEQNALKKGGGTLYTDTGYRKLYIESGRADQTPTKVAAAMYEGLRAANGM